MIHSCKSSKIDSLFFLRNTMIENNQKVISQDLIRDIIGYTALDDLRDLDRASPIFTREIYLSGLRVYYKKDGPMIVPNSAIIIRMKNGVEYTLYDRITHYDIGDRSIFKNRISFVRDMPLEPFNSAYKDSSTSSYLFRKGINTYILRNFDYDLSYRAIINVNMSIVSSIGLPNYIDLKSRLCYKIYIGSRIHIHICSFRILFAQN